MSITVALINYNNEKYIKRCIESILSQTRLPDEVIICDDCSKDQSIEIIREYIRFNPFIKLICNPHNLGPSANRHKAICNATSKFVINIDGDDFFCPDVIERTLLAFDSNQDSVVISSFFVCDENEILVDEIDTKNFCSLRINKKMRIIGSRSRGMPGNQFAFSKETYSKLGGLNIRINLYEDWDLILRITIAGIKWSHTGVVGYFYRKSSKGISSNSTILMHWKCSVKILVLNFYRSRYYIDLLLGFFMMFFSKGYKYLCGSNKPHGFN